MLFKYVTARRKDINDCTFQSDFQMLAYVTYCFSPNQKTAFF